MIPAQPAPQRPSAIHDELLLVSFVNLLAMLPLYAGWRLAEHMSAQASHTLWESLISASWAMCLAITVAITFIAMRLSSATTGGKRKTVIVFVNAAVMLIVWVVPDATGAPEWLRQALTDTWTVATSILLLLTSLTVPLNSLWRMLIGKPT